MPRKRVPALVRKLRAEWAQQMSIITRKSVAGAREDYQQLCRRIPPEQADTLLLYAIASNAETSVRGKQQGLGRAMLRMLLDLREDFRKAQRAADELAVTPTPHDPRGPCAGNCGRKAIDGKRTCGEVSCNLAARGAR